ncbi:MAG: cytochrome b/b6 domain-containing protein [Nitrospirota bacterium]|jgi:cytochrome b subunit of formate dehydrogenase
MSPENADQTIEPTPEGEVERFNLVFRIQHIIMLTTFLLLFFTGWALKFHEVEGSHRWMALWGGPKVAGIVHRTAGITMLLDSLFHLVYLGYRFSRGKMRWDLVVDFQDVRDLCQNIRYFLGLSPDKPRFRRFSYLQKFDYWAVFWGIFIIGASGLALTFPTKAALVFPAWSSNWIWELVYIMHSDEALLAIVFILFWHFYNEHLRPDVFPMNWIWLTGKMSVEELQERHPREFERLFPGGKAVVAEATAAVPAGAGPDEPTADDDLGDR